MNCVICGFPPCVLYKFKSEYRSHGAINTATLARSTVVLILLTVLTISIEAPHQNSLLVSIYVVLVSLITSTVSIAASINSRNLLHVLLNPSMLHCTKWVVITMSRCSPDVRRLESSRTFSCLDSFCAVWVSRGVRRGPFWLAGTL